MPESIIDVHYRFRVADETELVAVFHRYCAYDKSYGSTDSETLAEMAEELITNLDVVSRALGKHIGWDDLGLERVSSDYVAPPPERVGQVLKKYTLSNQRESLISVLTLADSTWGALEIGVWLDHGELRLFMDGVPIAAFADDVASTVDGPAYDALLYIQNYLSEGGTEHLLRLLKIADAPEALALCAFLAGADL